MKKLHRQLRALAQPYQDKRDDIGHAAITLAYAQKLLALEKGDEDIVIPAIILHDIGWSQVNPKHIILFNPKATRQDHLNMRINHQNEGVRLAAVILNTLDYPRDMKEEILEIILQHDTRVGFISRNEGLVRDADKLWRYSKVGFAADIRRSGRTIEQHAAIMENELNSPKYLYTTSAMKIAREQLALRKALK